MLNYVYLLIGYLIIINEKCQVDSNVKRVKFGTYSFFWHRARVDPCTIQVDPHRENRERKKLDFGAEKLESTRTWNGSTHIEKI